MARGAKKVATEDPEVVEQAAGASTARASRKRAASSAASSSAVEETAAETKPKRRGRPPKRAAEESKAPEVAAAEPKPKKRATKAAAKAPAPDAEAEAEAAGGLAVGDAAPAFCVVNHEQQEVSLADLAGKRVVIYFYPRDDTPGCTAEGKRFTALHDEFEALNTVVLGVSADKVAAHQKFRTKYGFPFTLLADTNRDMIRAYGAVKEGTKIKRSTVVVDEAGNVAKHWASVRGAAQHPDQVLEFIKSMA